MVKLYFYNSNLVQSMTASARELIMTKLIDISAILRHETDKAYLVYDGRNNKDKIELRVWLPKSQVEYNEDDGTFAMP